MSETKTTEVVSPSVSKKSILTLARSNLLPIALGLVVVLAGLSTLALYNGHKPQRKSQTTASSVGCATANSGNLIRQAAANLGLDKTAQLAPIVKQIQKLKSYEQDSDCAYIMTTYYYNIGDLQNAQKYLSDFNKVYGKSKKLSPLLSGYAGATELRSNVANLQKALNSPVNIVPVGNP